MVAVFVLRKGEIEPDAILDRCERNGAVVEEGHRPRVVFDRVSGEFRSRGLVVLVQSFEFVDTGECGCGLVGREDSVLTPETRLLQNLVIGEVLEVGFPRFTRFPPNPAADIASVLPLLDSGVEQLLLLGGEDGPGDCGTPQIIVRHSLQ